MCQDNGYFPTKIKTFKELPMYYPNIKGCITFYFLLGKFAGTQKAFTAERRPNIYVRYFREIFMKALVKSNFI